MLCDVNHRMLPLFATILHFGMIDQVQIANVCTVNKLNQSYDAQSSNWYTGLHIPARYNTRRNLVGLISHI